MLENYVLYSVYSYYTWAQLLQKDHFILVSSLVTDPQYPADHHGNGNPNNGNNWQDSLFLFVAIFFFFWLLSV